MAAGFTGVHNYREDLIVELVDLLKFHLTQNVYAWFDPTRLQIYKVNAVAVNSGEAQNRRYSFACTTNNFPSTLDVE